MTGRAIVAQFIRGSDGRFSLWSLTVIEDVIGRDGQAYVSREYYDVEISKLYGYIFHCSGGGGGRSRVAVDSPYFVSGGAAVREQPNRLCCWPIDETGKRTRSMRRRNRTRRLAMLPKEFNLHGGMDLLDWLRSNAIESDAVYCSECADFYPENSLCQHCWWCDKNGWWSTPSEPCGHTGEECWA